MSTSISVTFVEPTLTCTGASSNYETSQLIGILAQTQVGQSTIYAQNFCVLHYPTYRFDLSIPGVPYNGYGYGLAYPGDTVTLTDTITPTQTTVSYADSTAGYNGTFVGSGATLQTLQIGSFLIPGSVLGGFGSVPFTVNIR